MVRALRRLMFNTPFLFGAIFLSAFTIFKIRMATNYERGRRFEYSVMHRLQRAGFYVIRSAGSHSLADLVALGANGVILIQCKKARPSDSGIERIYWEASRLFEEHKFPPNTGFYIAYKRNGRVELLHLVGDDPLSKVMI